MSAVPVEPLGFVPVCPGVVFAVLVRGFRLSASAWSVVPDHFWWFVELAHPSVRVECLQVMDLLHVLDLLHDLVLALSFFQLLSHPCEVSSGPLTFRALAVLPAVSFFAAVRLALLWRPVHDLQVDSVSDQALDASHGPRVLEAECSLQVGRAFCAHFFPDDAVDAVFGDDRLTEPVLVHGPVVEGEDPVAVPAGHSSLQTLLLVHKWSLLVRLYSRRLLQVLALTAAVFHELVMPFQAYRMSDPRTLGGALWSRFKDHILPLGPGRDVSSKVAAHRNKEYFGELSRRLGSGQRTRAVSYQDGTMRFSDFDRDGLYGRAPRKVAVFGAPRQSSRALRSVRATARRMRALSRAQVLSRVRAHIAAYLPRRFRVPRPRYPRRRFPRRY